MNFRPHVHCEYCGQDGVMEITPAEYVKGQIECPNEGCTGWLYVGHGTDQERLLEKVTDIYERLEELENSK